MQPLVSAASYAQPLFEAAEAYVGERIGPLGRYGNGADFCEVFAGSANLSQEMAAAGFNVLEPRDIKKSRRGFWTTSRSTVQSWFGLLFPALCGVRGRGIMGGGRNFVGYGRSKGSW